MMGKNRNRNIVKSKMLLDETMLLWVKGIASMDNRKIAEIVTNDKSIADTLSDFFAATEKDHPVELERGETETVSRAILSTSEFSSDNTIPTVEGFIGHLYTETLSISQFGTLVTDLLGSQTAAPILAKTNEVMVQYTAMAWVMVRSVIQKILESIDAKPTSATVLVDDTIIEEKTSRPNDIEVYVMSPEQEKRAVELGIKVKDHILNIDQFYENEMRLVDEWKKDHGRFAPVNELYGMTMPEYRKWKHAVSLLFNDVIASNDLDEKVTELAVIDISTNKPETVASNNIGTKKQTPSESGSTNKPIDSSSTEYRSELYKKEGMASKNVVQNPNLYHKEKTTDNYCSGNLTMLRKTIRTYLVKYV